MNNYSKIEERLNGYINTMNNLPYATENELLQSTLGDLKSIAESHNINSKIKIKSILASESSLLAFGVTSTYLINTCKEINNEEVLSSYRMELERIFGLYCTDERFINKSELELKLKDQDFINLEYPYPITNMFLNTATILCCRILVGSFITDIEEGLKFIQDYLTKNYIEKSKKDEVRHIVIN